MNRERLTTKKEGINKLTLATHLSMSDLYVTRFFVLLQHQSYIPKLGMSFDGIKSEITNK